MGVVGYGYFGVDNVDGWFVVFGGGIELGMFGCVV